MEIRNQQFAIDKYDLQTLLGFIRLLILIVVPVFIGVHGSTRLDGIDLRDIADNYRESFWFFRFASDRVLLSIAAVFNIHTFRYMIAPLGAFVFVLVMGSYYVQDIYALPNFQTAFQYVLASLFGISYPSIVIDKGEPQLSKKEVNLIDKIGGPGFVVIEPGNAAMFRELRGPSKASVSTTYFLAPFETIAQTVNLDEQQGYKAKITAMTRDGIKVGISDIHFRYRIKQREEDGRLVPRSVKDPYPFSVEAIQNMTFNLMVQKDGLESWAAALERMVTGTIADYVSSHNIDYLTAPRTDQYNPRLELRNQFFMDSMKKRMADMGAELLWVDVGHVEIEDETVDDLRGNVWSAEWAGDAAEVRAYGEALRQAYKELGRAEAQSNLIMSIAGALSETDLHCTTPENIRRLLLARTAQILNAMTEQQSQDNPVEPPKLPDNQKDKPL
jgi:hypothetical protein